MLKKYNAFAALSILLLLFCTFIQPQNSDQTTYKWKVVSVYPRVIPIFHNGIQKFADDVRKVSKGQLDIKVYTADEYIDEINKSIKQNKVFDAVSDGVVEMGYGTATLWATSEETKAGSEFMFAVPFGLNAEGMYAWLHRGDGLRLWRKLYEPFGVIPFPIGNTGGAMAGWFRNEIKTIDDFKGLKIRTVGLTAKVMKKLDAIPKDKSSIESIKAYNNKELDAYVCQGPFIDQWLKLYRDPGPKNYYYPGWQEPGGVVSLIINKQAWEDLPDHLQETIKIVIGNTYRYFYNQIVSADSKALKELTENKDVKIRPLPENILDKLKQKSEEVLEEEAQKDKSGNFRKIYDAFKKFKKENSELRWNKILNLAVDYKKTITKPIILINDFLDELRNKEVATVNQEKDNSVVIYLDEKTTFEKKTAEISKVSTSAINRLSGIIAKYHIKLITVEVRNNYSYAFGRKSKNMKLAVERAEAIKNLLIKNNIDSSIIKSIPYGANKPVANEKDKESSQEKNSVEIRIYF